jgi:hypothetical protein
VIVHASINRGAVIVIGSSWSGCKIGASTDLALAYARKQISLPEWLVARKEIETRLALQRSRLRRTDDRRALREVVGQGVVLRRRWPELNLDQQRAIIATVLDRLLVSRSRFPGRIQFDPGRLEPVWKL